MPSTVLHSLEKIDAAAWNRLSGTDNPFLRHEFLLALERNGCVSPELGWTPAHVGLRDAAGTWTGVVPGYRKTNSYGELVFDWAWAEAYQRTGRRYYPKLVVAVPYTPATGTRLLVANPEDREPLMRATLAHAVAKQDSSLHWLFPDESDLQALTAAGFLPRVDVQYHWFNRGYGDFTDFLAGFSHAKRKQVKRERRRIAEAGIECRTLLGNAADDHIWQHVDTLYRRTFEYKWGTPTLNLGFFREISRTMGEQIVLVLAYRGEELIAVAFCLRSHDTLYGRNWGTYEQIDGLHFEVCYYQGIEYCIAEGLEKFEPGAQGEYKIARGFEPTLTHSAHWLADPDMAQAIGDFLRREKRAVSDYRDALADHLPFRQAD